MSVAALPPPLANAITLYVFGPGFGESQVIAFPDKRWMVVDSFLHGDRRCLPLDVLRHFGVERLDLLVVTHPDLDHIGGLDQLINGVDVLRAWRYPHGGLARDLFASLLARQPNNTRLHDLHAAAQALDTLEQKNRLHTAAFRTQSWSPGQMGYEVHCLAPVPFDSRRMRLQLDSIFSLDSANAITLSKRAERYFAGTSRAFGDRPNVVSLALLIAWGDQRVLLAGDVENGTSNPQSGWSGILASLQREHDDGLQGSPDLLQNLAAIKVAHHGSHRAFHPPAWTIHGSMVPASVVTPFNRGSHPPPHVTTLRAIRKHARTLVVTSNGGGAHAKALREGWSQDGPTTHPHGPDCAILTINASSVNVQTSGAATRFY